MQKCLIILVALFFTSCIGDSYGLHIYKGEHRGVCIRVGIMKIDKGKIKKKARFGVRVERTLPDGKCAEKKSKKNKPISIPTP